MGQKDLRLSVYGMFLLKIKYDEYVRYIKIVKFIMQRRDFPRNGQNMMHLLMLFKR